MEKGMAYVSKEEKKIPINDPSGKWADLTLLPEWGEKYYDVFTVKKHGKWVMLKALKKEYADIPEYRVMLEREFDTRYNLAHPHIVMVNDLEEVPGAGLSIITDDVYGYSLRRLMDENRLTPKIVERLKTQLLSAMEYIQENHLVHNPITPDTIIFTEFNENLKLIDVGFAASDHLPEQSMQEDIASYGKVLEEVLNHMPEADPRMRKVARKCQDRQHPYQSISDVKLALEKRSASQLYLLLCLFICIMACLVVWLMFSK